MIRRHKKPFFVVAACLILMAYGLASGNAVALELGAAVGLFVGGWLLRYEQARITPVTHEIGGQYLPIALSEAIESGFLVFDDGQLVHVFTEKDRGVFDAIDRLVRDHKEKGIGVYLTAGEAFALLASLDAMELSLPGYFKLFAGFASTQKLLAEFRGNHGDAK